MRRRSTTCASSVTLRIEDAQVVDLRLSRRVGTAVIAAAVIAAALTDPRRVGLPFASWTLDRLAAYLLEHEGIAMRRSRIDEILLKEGLRWRRQETWFGERVDPEFAEKS